MVQVLPQIPSFGNRLAQVLGDSIGAIGEGYIQGQTNKKDANILQQLGAGGKQEGDKFVPYTPIEKIGLIAKLSAEKQKTVGSLMAPLLKEDARQNRTDALLNKFEQPVNAPAQANPNQQQSETSPIVAEGKRYIDTLDSEKLALLEADPSTRYVARAIREQREADRKQNFKETEFKQRQISEANKETAAFRSEIANKAKNARVAITNKENLRKLIEKGDLDDPTYAIIANSLPAKLGQRLLSDDTVAYKSGLFDEYGVIKNVFPGATRVEEIRIFTDKLADLSLTDIQKDRVLSAGIQALEADVIRAEAAAEVEEKFPGIGILQFEKKVEELAKPKLDELLKKITNEYKTVTEEAEKNLTAEQAKALVKEAGGDKNKAREIAKKRGYTF
jgi:hypothetical protein